MKNPITIYEIAGKTFEHKLTIKDISVLGQGGIDIQKFIMNEENKLLMSEALGIMFVSIKNKPDSYTIDAYLEFLDSNDVNFAMFICKAKEIVINAYPKAKEEEDDEKNLSPVKAALQQMP